MVDSSVIGVASAIFTSLEETEVLPFSWFDLEELQFMLSLHLYLITMKQKTIYGILLFINTTVDRPCKLLDVLV